MKQLIQDVINWGRDTGIHDKLSASSQLVFAIGELCNELPDAIAKGKPADEVKKELGDVVVFYINYLVMERDDSAAIIFENNKVGFIYLSRYDRVVDLNDVIVKGLSHSATGRYSINFFTMLHAIANRLGTTLEECLRLAHDKNAKRRHTMRDGKLVKEGDLS